jgi:exonuclease III
MLYNIHFKREMILLIKKDIRKYFSEIVMIPDNREITLMTNKIEEKYNTFIHFIYRPAKPQEVENFWKCTEDILRKKDIGKNKHILIGDLNVQFGKEDSNIGKKTKLPEFFKKILKTNSLDDTYKIYNKDLKKSFTFFQIQENNEIKSRLDYILIPHELKNL